MRGHETHTGISRTVIHTQLAGGRQPHPFARGKDVKVTITDPLAAHRELSRTLKDRDMTDVTTYLETLK